MTDTRAFKIALDLDEAAEATGLSKESIRRAIHAGKLRAKRSSEKENGDGSGKYLVKVTELEAFVDGLVDA